MVQAADGSLTGQTPEGDTLRVREVWQDNLEAEMKVGAGRLRADRPRRRAADAPPPTRRLNRSLEPTALAPHPQLIRDVVDDFPFLAMDTEFPGVSAGGEGREQSELRGGATRA